MPVSEAKEAFFDLRREQGMAVTYDDVSLATQASDVDASEVDLTTQFSTNVELRIPFVSAAMDSVTGAEMATAMAKFGGIGVIHYGMSPKEQKREVRKVKLALNGVIENPITFEEDRPLDKILKKCEKKGWDFRTFPIVDNLGHLVGLLTSNDFAFAQDMSMTASEAMTPFNEIIAAEAGTSIEEAHQMMIDGKKKTLPLIDKDGKVEGLYIFSDVDRICRGNPDQYNLDNENRLRVAAAVPTNDQALQRIQLMQKYLDAVVIDTSTGDNKHARATLQEIKAAFPGLDVVVGNITNPASVAMLAALGADGIKVGQGPGSICTTRRELGYGVPQVTAIYECARAARALKKPIPVCGDGGIVFRGDISKAIAAGANAVMMGSMLAGTDETPVKPVILESGEKVVPYRGMGSEGAMRDSAAAIARYESHTGQRFARHVPVPQGVEAVVTYKGSVFGVLNDAVEQLKKSMSGSNAASIQDHQESTEFWQGTSAAMREAHAHDVRVTGSA